MHLVQPFTQYHSLVIRIVEIPIGPHCRMTRANCGWRRPDMNHLFEVMVVSSDLQSRRSLLRILNELDCDPLCAGPS
jgi:hypothetical protein